MWTDKVAGQLRRSPIPKPRQAPAPISDSVLSLGFLGSVGFGILGFTPKEFIELIRPNDAQAVKTAGNVDWDFD
jgi:hypothetical protein